MSEISLPYFLALPTTPAPWPGVVVIHEGNGMSPQLLRVCERLAGEGYAVIAPELFHRAGGPEAADFMTLIGSVQHADIESAAATLRSLGATKLGITGFCMGGQLSWEMAVRTTTFSAAGGFYGARVSTVLQQPNCPTLLFYGNEDPWVPMTEIEQVQAFHPDTFVYEGAGHGFMRDGSDDFREDASADAWSRLLRLFADNLRG